MSRRHANCVTARGPGDRQRGGQHRAAAGGALDVEPPAEGGDSIVDPDEPGAAWIGAADAVVAYFDPQHLLVDHRAHGSGLRVGMLDDVRERFGHDEVGARLDLGREPLGRQVDLHGEVEPFHDRIDPAAKPAACEVRGQDAVGELAQFFVGPLHVPERLGDQRLRRAVALLELPLRQAERDGGVDEPLLRAIVQVPDDAAAGRVGLGEQTRSRGGELVLALGIQDRHRDQLGEVRDPRLGVRREARLAPRGHGDHPPRPPADDDRTADRRADAQRLVLTCDRPGRILEAVQPRRPAALRHQGGDARPGPAQSGCRPPAGPCRSGSRRRRR